LAAGSADALVDTAKLEQSGFIQTTTLNVVGNAGFNSMLEKNFNEMKRSGFSAGLIAAGRINR
jgi:hypothetical protein